jgi:osmoprotectant transport system ATP-binding protein
MIDLRGISKSYNSSVALGPMDLTIGSGRTTVLIGPSGCGKSTLLRLIAGLVHSDTGEIRFDDEPLTPENLIAVRRRMGYVIQEGGLFAHLTARGNIVLMAKFLRWAPDRIQSRLNELAKLTRIPLPMLDRYPVELSGGQRQRVSLMRALMLDPEVLLLDEPLGALDPMVRHDLQVDLRQIFAELKRTVVLVTHDIAEAGFLGDQIVLLRQGQIVQRGALIDLVDRPASEFVVNFINAQRGPLEILGRNSHEK